MRQDVAEKLAHKIEMLSDDEFVHIYNKLLETIEDDENLEIGYPIIQKICGKEIILTKIISCESAEVRDDMGSFHTLPVDKDWLILHLSGLLELIDTQIEEKIELQLFDVNWTIEI